MNPGIEFSEAPPWPRPDRLPELSPVLQETSILANVLRVLRRHKVLFAFIVVLSSSAGLLIALTRQPVYMASSSVVIETSGKDVVTLKEVLAGVPADAEAIAGELELLSSREMLERVGTRLSLLEDPEFNPASKPSWRLLFEGMVKDWDLGWLLPNAPASAGWAARPMNRVVDALRMHLLIAPVGRSRVIRITCSSRNPTTAAAVANALAELYRDEHLHLRDEATRQANDWISARLEELRARADRSSQAVERYRAAHGLVRGRDSLLIEQQLTETSSQLTAARARVAEAKATLSDAERGVSSGRLDQLTSVLNSPLIQQLREQEAQIVARRANATATLGPAHPAALAVTAQLHGVQGRISAEVNRIVQSLRETVHVAQESEATLVDHLADVRREVDEANTHDVGLQDLQREADVNNALYQTFLTRSKETGPDVTFRSVNVRVLSQAVPPDRPVAPNRKMIAIAGGVLGLALGLAAVLARELLSKGLRTRADVEHLIGAAPIGAIPFCPPQSRPIDSLRLMEAVAALWARVAVSTGGAAPKSLLVTSAVMREGKTTLARLLGTVAAEQRHRVLIIDADLRCSSLTARIGRDSSLPGLAELIRGEARLANVVMREGHNVHIVPAGHCRESPVRLFASDAFAAVLREAERSYDVVIIDSPPVLIGADSWLIGRTVSATLLVVRWGRTPHAVVDAALRQLLDVGVHCVGAVLCCVDVNKVRLYDGAMTLAVSSRTRRYYERLLPSK